MSLSGNSSPDESLVNICFNIYCSYGLMQWHKACKNSWTDTPPSACGPTLWYILISRLQLYMNKPSCDRLSMLIPNTNVSDFGSRSALLQTNIMSGCWYNLHFFNVRHWQLSTFKWQQMVTVDYISAVPSFALVDYHLTWLERTPIS